MLYLHEIIDIVGTGQESYLETVGERARHSEREGISRLMGTWKVIGSTNRWPRVVNLWEMDGWDHWAAALERQFLPGRIDGELAPWWAKATAWRSGGFDRILTPTSWSPTRDQLQATGLRAWVCTHTITQVAPGRAADFLAAIDTLRPMRARRSLTLLGAYAAAMRSDEVITIWAAPDFRTLCAHSATEPDAETRAWEKQVMPMRQSYETMWLVPSAACFFHPERKT